MNYNLRKLKIDLILDEFYNKEQVYGRMINIIPGPISSGESALINVFSMMYQVMKKQTEKNILLIVDEIDAFLHPRWQQEILTHIVRWINEGKEFQNKKVQLLIASHSPIILSDIPLNNVIHLKKFKVVKSEKSTFAANINLLFYDSFFMDNGSIGEFAKTKLKQVIEFLDNPCEDEKMRKEVLYIIENIGEPYVKKKLQNHPNYLKVKGDI